MFIRLRHRGAYVTALKRFYNAAYALPPRSQDMYSVIICGQFMVRLKDEPDMRSCDGLLRARKLNMLYARLHDPWYW